MKPGLTEDWAQSGGKSRRTDSGDDDEGQDGGKCEHDAGDDSSAKNDDDTVGYYCAPTARKSQTRWALV